MMQHHQSVIRSLGRAIVFAGLLVSSAGLPAHAQSWPRPHADGANGSFLDVTTAPAKTAPITIPGLGTFAVGAGPVVAPDGTVYLGTREGKLVALHPDGSPFWSRDITRGQSIVASPAISADGSIYVVGVRKYRDNRADANPKGERVESVLHHFNASGAWLEQTPFPTHDRGPGAFAAPNIWRSGATEIIIVPTVYPYTYGGGHSVELIAFSTDSRPVARQLVTDYAPAVTGGSGLSDVRTILCPIPPYAGCVEFDPRSVAGFRPPPPSVDIFTAPGGAIPIVLASDHIKDLVGYSFTGTQFTELFRVHSDDRILRSAPMTIPDGHTLIGIQSLFEEEDGDVRVASKGGIAFAGPKLDRTAPITNLAPVFATPTRMADGRVFLVTGDGTLAVLRGRRVRTLSIDASGSVVSAAASRNHVFVSAADAFLTLDTNTLAEAARIDWTGGGLNPPAIGPRGHVYALASDILFVFPPPQQAPAGGAMGGTGTAADPTP